jgi:Flp pilus assembly protein TadG
MFTVRRSRRRTTPRALVGISFVSARNSSADRGAAAVEFALLLPLVLLILFGVIDFGFALDAKIKLTQAAREGARVASFPDSTEADVESRTQRATDLTGVGVTTINACTATNWEKADARVETTYTFQFVTPVGALAGFFGGVGLGSQITLTATGVMPCERRLTG